MTLAYTKDGMEMHRGIRHSMMHDLQESAVRPAVKAGTRYMGTSVLQKHLVTLIARNLQEIRPSQIRPHHTVFPSAPHTSVPQRDSELGVATSYPSCKHKLRTSKILGAKLQFQMRMTQKHTAHTTFHVALRFRGSGGRHLQRRIAGRHHKGGTVGHSTAGFARRRSMKASVPYTLWRRARLPLPLPVMTAAGVDATRCS